MKRTICLLLILALLMTFAGCGTAGPEPTPEPTAEPTPTPEPTETAGMDYSLLWNGSACAGEYTGAILHALPEGKGTFTGVNAAGEPFSWDGLWHAGLPEGTGTLRAAGVTVELEGVNTTGEYDGRAESCVPEGEGTFTAADADGVIFTYTGQWSGGEISGEGTLRFEAENRYVRSGRFVSGRFAPDWVGALATLGTCEPAFTLTQAQRDFIAEHPELWENESHLNYLKSAYKKQYNRSLTIKKIFQQPDLIGEPCWIQINSLRVLRAYTVTLGEHSFTCVTAAESTYSYPMRVILPDAVEGLRRGQRFHVSAMPLAMSEYVTVNGVNQPCLVMLAGDAYISNLS